MSMQAPGIVTGGDKLPFQVVHGLCYIFIRMCVHFIYMYVYVCVYISAYVSQHVNVRKSASLSVYTRNANMRVRVLIVVYI